MAKSQLLDYPLDIIIEIFRSCDSLQDLFALGRTCKHLQLCLRENNRHILYPVSKRSFIAFDPALAAVRATATVRHFQIHRNPLSQTTEQSEEKAAFESTAIPEIDFEDFSGEYRLPDLDEIRSVHQLEHLADCIHVMLCTSDFPNPGRRMNLSYTADLWYWNAVRGQDIRNLPRNKWTEPNEMLKNWRRRFYTSIFNVIVCGAYLAKFYLEPFVGDLPVVHTLLEKLCNEGLTNEELESLDPVGDGWRVDLNADEVKYLKSYPVYDFDRSHEANLDAAFTPLMKYLLGQKWTAADLEQEERWHWQRSRSAPDYDPQIHKILMVYAAYQIIQPLFRNKGDRMRLGRDEQNFHPAERQPELPDNAFTDIPIVFPGIFQAEIVRVPRSLQDAGKRHLLVRPEDPHNPPIDILAALDSLNWDRRNCIYNGEIRFFNFVLKKYFHRKIAQEFDDENWSQHIFFRWIEMGEAFEYNLDNCFYCRVVI